MDIGAAMRQKVFQRIGARPELITRRDPWGNPIISLPLPSDYVPRSNQLADRLELRINRDTGAAIDLGEVCERIHGGWMAGCIPQGLLHDFIRRWLAATERRGEQIEMELQ